MTLGSAIIVYAEAMNRSEMICADYPSFIAHVQKEVFPRIQKRMQGGKVPFPMFHGTDMAVLQMSDEERVEAFMLMHRYLRYQTEQVPSVLEESRHFTWQWKEMAVVLSLELPRLLSLPFSDGAISLCGLAPACQYAIRSSHFGMVGRSLYYLRLAEQIAISLGRMKWKVGGADFTKAQQLVERFWNNPPRPVVLMVEDLDDAASFVWEDGRAAFPENGKGRTSCLSFVTDSFRYLKPVDLHRAIRLDIRPDNCAQFVQDYNRLFVCNVV